VSACGRLLPRPRALSALCLALLCAGWPAESASGAVPCKEPAEAPPEALDETVACWRLYGDEIRARAALDALSKTGREGKDRAALHRALQEAGRGAYKKAIARLERVARRHPDWLGASVQLGRLLKETGEHRRARSVLDRLAKLHDEGSVRTSQDLAWLGEALTLLDFPRDANDIFREAVRADRRNVHALLAWGRLLLAKHNPKEAVESFRDALKVWPGHPEALALEARARFEAGGDVAGAGKLLRQALARNPDLKEGLLLQATIALFLEDREGARATVQRILERNARDRDALALLGAAAFLESGHKAVGRFWKKARAVNPRDAAFWHRIAFFAERFHRYEQGVRALDRALGLDPSYTPALVDLGLAHSRLGDDSKARVFVAKAREQDPFDRRAYHLSEGYYATVRKDYRSFDAGGTTYLLHKSEAEVLKELVPRWVEAGHAHYRARYGGALPHPLRVEVFKAPQTFAVRAVGLPRFWAHGVCFGRILALRSPAAGDFNAREVLTHEMSHAYHLQLTGGRVPRWFTEGLAELDTMQADPTLAREIDEPMAERHRAGEMVSICGLSNAFVKARTGGALVQAYMQARLVLEWIAARGGPNALRAMLQSFKESSDHGAALKAGLKLSCRQADRAFSKWTEERLAPLLPPHPHVPHGLPPRPVLEARAKQGDGRAGALLAAGLQRAGRTGEALEVLDALGPGPPPEADLVRARVRAADGDARGAEQLLSSLEARGHGGAQVIALRAELASEGGDPAAAARLWAKTAELAPPSSELLASWSRALEAAGREDEARAVNLRRAELDEHSGTLREQIASKAVARGKPREAKAAIRLLMEVRPLSGETWRLRGRLAMMDGRRCGDAVKAFERARDLGARLDETSLLDEAECRLSAGDEEGARRLLRLLSATRPDHPRLKELKGRLERKR